MINCVSESSCTGCGACQNKCSKNAITMIWNEKGFLQPLIDKKECNGCGLCDLICPALNTTEQKKILKLSGGYYADKNVVAKSSSGGAFYMLASHIIANKGIVVGVVWNNDFLPYHKSISQMEELVEMHGSKYVQSDKKDIYIEIERHLKDKKEVLFTGTPCECAAVRNYLGKEYDNLYLVEFICHGIPSPGIWKDYLQNICAVNNITPTEICFRSKERYGWHSFELKISQKEQAFYYPLRNDLFFNGFVENLFLRDCCYSCQYKNKKTYADISIADFWGSDKFAPNLDKASGRDGLSLIACFTEKGLQLVETACKNGMFVNEILSAEEAYFGNTASICSPKRNKYTDKFYQYKQKYGTICALNKFAKYTTGKKIRNRVVWKLQAILEKRGK